MSVESDLRTVLLTLSAVTDLVGTGATARIRPYALHEGDDRAQPNVIIESDNERPLNTIDGLGGRVYADVTISCRAMTPTAARALAEAVRLNGTDPGTGLAGIANASPLIDCVLDDSTPGRTTWADGSDRAWFAIMQRYIVTYLEVV